MPDNRVNGMLLNTAYCANLALLAVRALHIYGAAGFLAPQRTEKNWRLYGKQDLARLTEILTLKPLDERRLTGLPPPRPLQSPPKQPALLDRLEDRFRPFRIQDLVIGKPAFDVGHVGGFIRLQGLDMRSCILRP